MNGLFFSKARTMNGVGYEILARTPVPQLPTSYPSLETLCCPREETVDPKIPIERISDNSDQTSRIPRLI